MKSDREGTFVFENYKQLKERHFSSATIPEEQGSGGLSHQDRCHFIKDIAHYCGSKALALSVQQHLVAATIC